VCPHPTAFITTPYRLLIHGEPSNPAYFSAKSDHQPTHPASTSTHTRTLDTPFENDPGSATGHTSRSHSSSEQRRSPTDALSRSRPNAPEEKSKKFAKFKFSLTAPPPKPKPKQPKQPGQGPPAVVSCTPVLSSVGRFSSLLPLAHRWPWRRWKCQTHQVRHHPFPRRRS
jgi:hypothetical protein